MKKLFFIAFVALICSCKKSTTSSPSVKDLLVSKTWKYTAFSDNSSPYTSWCNLNNLYNYTIDGSLFIETGDNMGACSGPPIGTLQKFSWTLSSDNQWLIWQNKPYPVNEADSFQIVSITATTLKTKRIVNKSTPPIDVWEDTFTAQ